MTTATDTRSRRKTGLTPEHKDALALGREQGRVIRRYLEALANHRPKRGRKRLPQTIQRRLAQIEERLPDADQLMRVKLGQEKLNLAVELARLTAPKVDLVELQREFEQVAAEYSARKGITYAAWREQGVPADVLMRAGIKRGG